MKIRNVFNCRSLKKLWRRFWHWKYGNCYVFNSGLMENGTEVPVMKVDKAGPNHGEFFMDTASISFERRLNSKRRQITVVWEKKISVSRFTPPASPFKPLLNRTLLYYPSCFQNTVARGQSRPLLASVEVRAFCA